jgi:hypothetical protein
MEAFNEVMSSYQVRIHEAKLVAAKQAVKDFNSKKNTEIRHQLKAAVTAKTVELFKLVQGSAAVSADQQQGADEVSDSQQQNSAEEASSDSQKQGAEVASSESQKSGAATTPKKELDTDLDLSTIDVGNLKSDALDATLEGKNINSVFATISSMLEPSLKLIGDTVQVKINAKIPIMIDGGFTAVNIGIKGKAIKLPKFIKISPEISVGMSIGLLGSLDLTASIGGSVSGAGDTVRDAFNMISYAMYRRSLKSKMVPHGMVSSLWGLGGASADEAHGETESQAKEREHKEWASSMEEKMTDKWSAESGGFVSGKASANVGINQLASASGEAEVKYYNGQRYKKRTKKGPVVDESVQKLVIGVNGSVGAAVSGAGAGEFSVEWSNGNVSSLDGMLSGSLGIDLGKLGGNLAKDSAAGLAEYVSSAFASSAVPLVRNLSSKADSQLEAQKRLKPELAAANIDPSALSSKVAANQSDVGQGVAEAIKQKAQSKKLEEAEAVAKKTTLKDRANAFFKKTDYKGLGKDALGAGARFGIGEASNALKTAHLGVESVGVKPFLSNGPASLSSKASTSAPIDSKLALNLTFLLSKDMQKEPRKWDIDLIVNYDKAYSLNLYYFTAELKKTDPVYYKKLA